MSFLFQKIRRLIAKIPYRTGIDHERSAASRNLMISMSNQDACRRAEHKSFISLVAAVEDWCTNIRQWEDLQNLIARERERIADTRWNLAWNNKVSAQIKLDDANVKTDTFGGQDKLWNPYDAPLRD